MKYRNTEIQKKVSEQIFNKLRIMKIEWKGIVHLF